MEFITNREDVAEIERLLPNLPFDKGMARSAVPRITEPRRRYHLPSTQAHLRRLEPATLVSDKPSDSSEQWET